MADTVFRVQVGAQIQTSTVTLRKDIQNILNDIGKRNPPQVTVSLAKTASRQRLTQDLNDLLKNQQIGITLGLKGGGSLRGSSGAKITKELIGITSQLSQHQAAKITLHLDTAASQKALLAELKKLNLGVNITPRNNNGGGGTDLYAQAQRQAAAMQAQANAKFVKSIPLDSTSQQYQVLQAQGQRLMQQAQQLRDAYLQSADAQKRGITQQDFDKQVAGNKRIQESVDRIREAHAKVTDAQAKVASKSQSDRQKQKADVIKWSKSIVSAAASAKQSLNMATPAGEEYNQKLIALKKEAIANKWSLKEFSDALRTWKKEASNAGAMAQTAGEKFSRMLGEKIGYGAIALLLAKVRQALGEVYTNVVNIDAAMTELKKVTDETASSYDKFLSQSGAKARELGSTMTDMINATAGFARLGYSLADSAELAETAIVYNNVGDGIESIDDATESVISTMQAFNIAANDSMSIADKFNQIGRQNCPAA